MFHTHLFKPNEKDPEMLYCHCGKIKDIHRHIWIEEIEIKERGTAFTKGNVLKCKICGDFKNHFVWD